MTRSAVDEARKDVARTRAKLRRIEAEHDRLNAHLRDAEAFVKMYDVYAGPGELAPAYTIPGVRKMTIAEAVAAVLGEMHGQARMTTILTVLKDLGRMPGKKGDYGSVAGTLKRRSDLFEKVSPGTWRLREITAPTTPPNGGVEDQSASVQAGNGTGVAPSSLAARQTAPVSPRDTHGSASHGVESGG